MAGQGHPVKRGRLQQQTAGAVVAGLVKRDPFPVVVAAPVDMSNSGLRSLLRRMPMRSELLAAAARLAVLPVVPVGLA